MSRGSEHQREKPRPTPSPVEVYLAGLSPSSKRRMSAALRRAAQILGIDDYESHPWRDLDPAQVARVREHMAADGAAPVTINVVLSALRGVARSALDPDPSALSRQEVERLDAIRATRNAPVKRHTAPGRALTGAELSALMATCMRDRTAMGARDAAMVHSLYSTGMTPASSST